MTVYPKKSPPLYVWLVAIALSLSIIAGADFIFGEPSLKYLNANRLNVIPTGKESRRIVIIGSSSTRLAIYFDTLLSSIATSNRLENYSFNRFVLGGPHPSSFYPLYEKILETEPDIVMIQNLMLFYDKVIINPNYDSHKKYFKQWIGNLIGIEPFNKNYYFNRKQAGFMRSHKILEVQNKKQTPAEEKRFKKKKAELIIRRVEELPKELEKFLVEARAKGIKVISHDIPIAPRIRSALPLTEEQRQLLQDQYHEKYGVTFWEFPFELQMKDYMDFVHVVPEVQKKYSTWLVLQIGKMDE